MGPATTPDSQGFGGHPDESAAGLAWRRRDRGEGAAPGRRARRPGAAGGSPPPGPRLRTLLGGAETMIKMAMIRLVASAWVPVVQNDGVIGVHVRV